MPLKSALPLKASGIPMRMSVSASEYSVSILNRGSQTRTLFSRDLLSDGRQLKLYGGTLLAIVLATELDVLNRVLDTTSLTGGQWLVCLLLAAALIAVEEITKLFLRRQQPATHGEAS